MSVLVRPPDGRAMRRGRTWLHATILITGMMAGTILGAGSASAHAFPVHEVPHPGAVLGTAPSEVVITFTENVNAHFSTISVRKAGGPRVDTGGVVRDPHDHKILRVGIQGRLRAGTYVVTWHALAMDGHRTQGHYDFVVSP